LTKIGPHPPPRHNRVTVQDTVSIHVFANAHMA
jgi:hypothetical protein